MYSMPRRTGTLLGAVSALLLVLALTYVIFVRTSLGQRMDQRLLTPVRDGGDQTSVLYGPADEVLATLDNPMVFALLLAVIVLVGLVSGRGAAGLVGVGVVGASIVAAGVLKQLMPRPDLDFLGSTHNSFPSGHVAATTGLVFALLLVLPHRFRRWCAVPGVVCVCVVGAATMVVSWHRFSDVIGGVLLATALGCLALVVKSVLTSSVGNE